MAPLTKFDTKPSDLFLDSFKGRDPALSGLKDNQPVKARVLEVLSPKKATISILGKKVTVKTEALLQAGTEIEVKAKTAPDGSRVLRIIPKEQPGANDLIPHTFRGKKSELSHFTENKAVKAKVLEVIPKGQALISVSGKKITVQTEAPLKAGQDLVVSAKSTADGSRFLRIIPDRGGMPVQVKQQIIQSFEKSQPYEDILKLTDSIQDASEKIQGSGDIKETGIRDIAVKIKQLLQRISLRSERPDKRQLMDLVKDGGLQLERKIAQIVDQKGPEVNPGELKKIISEDLKGLSGLLKDVTEPNETIRTLPVNKIIEKLEGLQILNVQTHEEGGKFIIPVPVMFDEEFTMGQMLIDLGKESEDKSDDREKVVKIAFYLQMTNIGHVRADFSVLKKGITGVFAVSDPDTKKLLDDNISTLVDNLERADFKAAGIKCILTEKEVLEKTNLTEETVADSEGYLNIIV